MSNAAEWILKIAALLSAAGVIAKAIHRIYKMVKAIYDKVQEMETRQKQLEEYERDNYMNTLRLTIMSEEMPLSERIAAGDKYIKYGGNGEVKHKYEQLLRQLDKK